jgi:hypothetical protein
MQYMQEQGHTDKASAEERTRMQGHKAQRNYARHALFQRCMHVLLPAALCCLTPALHPMLLALWPMAGTG